MTAQTIKKLVLVSSVFLLAAGCNSTQPTTTNTTGTQATPTQQTTTTTTTGEKTYTMADVQAASTPENCLSAINGKVYDLTAWINKHPGGDKNILKICGIDGSSAFDGKHGGQTKPETVLKGFSVGVLK
jgi:cytochrome b involved in lipid metabolism